MTNAAYHAAMEEAKLWNDMYGLLDEPQHEALALRQREAALEAAKVYEKILEPHTKDLMIRVLQIDEEIAWLRSCHLRHGPNGQPIHDRVGDAARARLLDRAGADLAAAVDNARAAFQALDLPLPGRLK
jgi:hypothetical protein